MNNSNISDNDILNRHINPLKRKSSFYSCECFFCKFPNYYEKS
uniref:Uncharacterized protein n=1 Tax=viral metagenome TaxID=1070528 RepID=A0A6C0JPQ8_9ZZZZ